MVAQVTQPGQCFFLDIVPSTSPVGGLSSGSHFKQYLLAVCAFSQFPLMMILFPLMMILILLLCISLLHPSGVTQSEMRLE